jgi:uncharacterized protein (UPF0332 family)
LTDAQRALLTKARRTIQSARLLLADGDYDGAVSRAYYAMFYVAEALLLSKGLTFSKHSAVISAFGKEFAKTGTIPAEYHRYLADAQEARNTGDYQVVSHLTEEETGEHITHAECFLKVGEELLRQNSNASGHNSGPEDHGEG